MNKQLIRQLSMASAALWKLRYHFEGDDIIHKEMVINPSHKLGHFRLWVKMHIIHLIQLLFQVSFYSRDFNFIFFYLELNLCRRKKKEKDGKKPKSEVEIWITTGLWMQLWQRLLAPKVSFAPVMSIPYSLKYSLGRASAWEDTCPAHCSLHMEITIILSSATLLQLTQWK